MQVITSAEFHPHHCNVFAYSSSKGCIRLADMRSSALCDRHSKAFEEQESQANKSFFSEIIASISDISFSRDGRYILSRDYMTLKLWDLNKENAPVATYNVHEHLRARVRRSDTPMHGRVNISGWHAAWPHGGLQPSTLLTLSTCNGFA